MNKEKQALKRVLKTTDAIYLVIGAVFGSGIFLTTGLVAGDLPYSGLMWLAWIGGGAVTIMGALIYAELGTMDPTAGGPYIYLKKAFGRGPAFLYGWIFFWIIGGGGIAALAVGFAEYFGAIVPGLSLMNTLVHISLGGRTFALSAGHLVAVGAICSLTFFNMRGVRRGVRVQNVLTLARIAALLGLVVGGIFFAFKTRFVNVGPLWPPRGSWPSWTAFGAGLTAVLWAYDGWYAVNCTAEEIEAPGRTIPRALFLGTAAVLFLYLSANIVYSLALPMNRLRGLVRVGEAAASNIFGPAVAPVFAAIVALTIFGCLSANILFCARVPFAMARDGSFVGALGVVSDRTGTPSRALAAQMVLASALALTGTYQSLIRYVIFALVLFFAATGLALVFLRSKDPRAERPYRVRPYPLLPLAFILCNLAVFAALILEEPRQALIGTALILSGIPAYFVWGRKRPAPAVPGEGI